MKKILYSFLLSVICIGSIYAQDEAVYNQYLINTTLINPAYAGFADKHQIFMNLRTQWTGFPGAPKTYALSYNGAFGNNFGLGGMLFSENIASLSRLRGQLSYAFRFKLKDDFKASIGFSTEFHRVRLLSSAEYDQGDLVANDYLNGNTYFDASLGLYGAYKDQIFAGLTLPNLIRTRIGTIGDDTTKSSAFKHFLLFAGYRYRSDEFTIEPSLQIRKVMNSPFQVDINIKASFLQDKLIGGLTYRPGSGGGLVFLVGTKLSWFQLYYSYDVSFEKFQRYTSGSHEITLGFEFERRANKFDRSKRYRN